MARSTITPTPSVPPRASHSFSAVSLAVITLAFWRLRRTWFFLLMTTLGTIAAVLISCAVPLFSDITTTAGFHDAFKNSATGTDINIDMYTQGLTTPISQQVRQQVDPIFQHYLNNYMSQPSAFSVTPPSVSIAGPTALVPSGNYVLTLHGTDVTQAAPHMKLLQGRLPEAHSSDSTVEIMVTPDTAQNLHLRVGMSLTLGMSYEKNFVLDPYYIGQPAPVYGTPITARLVGIFNIVSTDIAFWHNNDFKALTQIGRPPIVFYSFLMSNNAYLNVLDRIASKQHIAAPFAQDNYTLSWDYHLDPTRISVKQIDDLTHTLAALRKSLTDTFGDVESPDFSLPTAAIPTPYITHVFLFSSLLPTSQVPSVLDDYSSRVALARIPVIIILAQVIALLLFFVSMMIDLLVDRQTDAIAVMRSRGASGRQIFGALFTQCIGVSVIAFFFGVPLAALAVYLFAQHILASANQDVLSIITAHPLTAMLSASGYGLAVIAVALLAMAISLWRAMSMDVLSIRREAARSTRKPLWQRLNLDIVAAVIALVGFAVSIYLTRVGSFLGTQSKALISTPLTLIAPIFLVIGSIFLFLRLFPVLLRLISGMAVRGRSAAPMLALAQMARAPQQSIRMIMLLSLALSFTIFALIFSASQNQRALDIANYEAGADFRGNLGSAANNNQFSITQIIGQYRKISGVISASAGYIGQGSTSADRFTLPIQVRAIDSGTYAQTALWSEQDSTQSLASLLNVLQRNKQRGISTNTLPVIVDALTWDKLSLHMGATFLVSNSTLQFSDMHCVVVGKVEHIPTVNDSFESIDTGDLPPPGGVLLDYQTYDTIYQHDNVQSGLSAEDLPINQVYLRTKNDAESLASVRASLNTFNLRLLNLYDRHALLDSMQADPLFVNLVGVLTLGAITALLLAVAGNLLASSISARTRMTNFAVLRALGTTPPQVASVLSWEQGIIYSTAILLGIIFGALLSVTIVPNLIFTSIPASGILGTLSTGEFFALQHVIPTQTIIPSSLGITFLVLIATCSSVLLMMVRIVSRPSMSQLLRLNED